MEIAILLWQSKIFTKLALFNYKPGFYIHLIEDFDSDKEDILTIVLIE